MKEDGQFFDVVRWSSRFSVSARNVSKPAIM
jgi:hypothetical protein